MISTLRVKLAVLIGFAALLGCAEPDGATPESPAEARQEANLGAVSASLTADDIAKIEHVQQQYPQEGRVYEFLLSTLVEAKADDDWTQLEAARVDGAASSAAALCGDPCLGSDIHPRVDCRETLCRVVFTAAEVSADALEMYAVTALMDTPHELMVVPTPGAIDVILFRDAEQLREPIEALRQQQ